MNEQNEALSHHGILGQKWGIRRYQNKDGSLTPAGRRRAQKLKNEFTQLTGKKMSGKIPQEDPSKKSVKQLSDQELNDRIRRLQNEKQALSLETDLSGNGKKFVRSIGKNVLAPAAIDAGRSLLTRMFTKWGTEKLGLDKGSVDEFQKEINELKKSTEYAELKKRKYAAERDLKNMLANEKEKAKKEPKIERVEAEVIDDNYKRFRNSSEYNSGERFYKNNVEEAVYTEKNNNSTALTVYKNAGNDWFDRLYRK